MANVNETENIKRFMNAKDRARKLIQMDANGTLDEVKKNANLSGKFSYDANGMVETNIMESHSPTREFNPYKTQGLNDSKLPSAIVESFKTNNIDTSGLGGAIGGRGGSILDDLDMLTNGKVLQEETIQIQQPKQQKQVIQETVQVQPQVTANIDYSMIKMIVEDCMRKYTSALKKQILSESKTTQDVGTLQAMKIGNKFSFIDSKGNVYEATLTKKGNINEKGGK